MTTRPDQTLCVLAVHHDNQAEVEHYIEHVLGLPVPEGWRVVISVADNSRNWSDVDRQDTRVIVTVPKSNLGYLNGCAHALSAWAALDGRAPDWVAVTNTDLTFDSDAFVQLLSTEWQSETAAVAPRIISSVGHNQNPFLRRRPSRTRLVLLRLAFRDSIFRPAFSGLLRSHAYHAWRRMKSRRQAVSAGMRPSDSSAEATDLTYAPHGSCVFLSRSFFEAGCSLSMTWMMFGEEIHLAEQMLRAGLKVALAPHIRVLHAMAGPTHAIPSSVLMDWRADSLQHLIDLYFSDHRSDSSRT